MSELSSNPSYRRQSNGSYFGCGSTPWYPGPSQSHDVEALGRVHFDPWLMLESLTQRFRHVSSSTTICHHLPITSPSSRRIRQLTSITTAMGAPARRQSSWTGRLERRWRNFLNSKLSKSCTVVELTGFSWADCWRMHANQESKTTRLGVKFLVGKLSNNCTASCHIYLGSLIL